VHRLSGGVGRDLWVLQGPAGPGAQGKSRCAAGLVCLCICVSTGLFCVCVSVCVRACVCACK